MRKFDNLQVSQEQAVNALNTASEQVFNNLKTYTYSCQNHSSTNLTYPICENNQWTCGFWPGEIWLAFEHTGNKVFKYAGQIMVENFFNRINKKISVDHHDMGFLYTPSCVSSYILTGNKRAREAAILAADQLISRFQPTGEFIQAWGEYGVPENYRYIIDCLLNLPLLYWASEETSDEKYKNIALKHIKTCLKYSVRSDGSTYHTVFMNPKTSEFSHGATCQGYSDESFWARGQAWSVYGIALSYRYTKDEQYIDIFKKNLEFYLSKLPDDMIPYWDMIFTNGSDEPRDSSSASIVACGLLEMAKYANESDKEYYLKTAKQIIKSLIDNYSVKDFNQSNGLVLHATYSKKTPYNTCTEEGVDECVSWGDYFYMEALMRITRDWNPYW